MPAPTPRLGGRALQDEVATVSNLRLLFAHDHRFLTGPSGSLYTQGSFPSAIWHRYLQHFDTVEVFARDEGSIKNQQLARSDHEGVKFTLVGPMSFAERLGLVTGKADYLLAQAIHNSDAVISRLPSDLGLLAARHARQQGKPLLIEAVGCAFDGYGNQGSLASRLYAPVAMWRMRQAIKSAPFVLYVTRKWLQRRYPANPTAVTTDASNVALEPQSSSVAEQRELRLKELDTGRAPVFGTVASLRTRSKGIQTALAAIAKLRRERRVDVQYRVLGPGDIAPWQHEADALGIGDLVRFEGARPAGRPVLEWLDTIDVHLQPSYQEGLPRSTIEAMSRGCACVGSTAGGIPEIIPADRVHAPGDVGALADLLEALLNDPQMIADASREDRTTAGNYEGGFLERRRSALFGKFAQAAAAVRKRC
ncbi:glycosyltransferase family 4 protein [Qipengyuania sp. YIM B01966]|uniref:glycosyltransferase family 4 protein n=1 Tax=Qipengyuania sp. YIM B01966 TaxID=2778646 RepID=UPI0018F4C0D0|nr:glycosyltransferase family 4 protein [Qipengyuania sp. YIM B01966]